MRNDAAPGGSYILNYQQLELLVPDTEACKARVPVLVVLFLGVLMAALDIAIVGPALPAIRDAFSVGDRLTAWIFATYVLFGLVSSLFMSKLSDRIGRRAVYMLDVALFGAGSLVVAVSPSFAVVLAGRAIQGAGSGGLWPIASAVIGETFPEEQKGSALGLIGAVFGLAFLIGPPVGGALLLLSWHWLFIVNVPFAVVLLVMANRVLPKSKAAKSARFDAAGMAVMSIALAAFAFGLNQIRTHRFASSLVSWRVLPFLLVPLILVPVIARIESLARDPVLHPELFRNRQISIGSALSFAAGFAEGTLVFVPAYTVAAFGITESTASFLLLPPVVAVAVGLPMWGSLLGRVGSRTVVMTGLVLSVVGMLLLGYLGDRFVWYIASSLALGLGMSGLLGAPLRYIMTNEAPEGYRTVTQGLITVSTSVGQLISGALVGALAGSFGGGTRGYSLAYRWVGFLFIAFLVLATGLKSRAREKSTGAR